MSVSSSGKQVSDRVISFSLLTHLHIHIHTHTYAVVQQSSEHVLRLSRPAQKQPHGGRQQLHLDPQRGLTPHSINEHLQRVGSTGHSLTIHAQQPQQGLPALMENEQMDANDSV